MNTAPVIPRPAPTQNLIWDVARLVAKDWYRQACRTPSAALYLWWRRALPSERMSLPIVGETAPNMAYYQSIQISNAWNVDIATRKIAEAMQGLEILGSGASEPKV